MTIELIILDFDGTLCSTHGGIAACIVSTFDHFGWPPPSLTDVETVIRSGVVIAEALDRLSGHRLSPIEVGTWAQRYRALYDSGEGLAQTTLFPGVRKGLSEIREAGCNVVVLTNKGEFAVLQALDHFDLSRYIDRVFGDVPGVPRKPDPGSWRMLIQPAYRGLASESTVVVGDTVADLGYARAIGARSCWARYGFGDVAACEALEPDIVLDSFGELATAMARLA